MGTVHKPNRNTFDLVIIVDNIDAIKVWSEQIECALAGLNPQYHVARSGISHLDRNRNRFSSTKKLLFLLDTQQRTFDTQMMKRWIEHFCRRRHNDVMCVLVDSTSHVFDSCADDMGKGGINVVKTEDIANFHNWWPTLVEFLFLKTKAASKVLNYSLENVRSHEDDQLPRRLTQCLDAFVDPDKTNASTKCQTVKVVGGYGEENPQTQENLHVVLASFRVDRSLYDRCNSVHTRAEVLRCVLFILIDSGIVPLRRFSRTDLVRQKRQLMFLISSFVFVMNIPAALLVFCYAFVPIVGFIISLHPVFKADILCFMIIFYLFFFLVPFAISGTIVLAGINICLSNTSILFCFFILPFAYFVGWVTVMHHIVKKQLDCKYGIWSLPGYLWSTEYVLPNWCWWFYLPVFITHGVLVVVCVIILITSCTFFIYLEFFKSKALVNAYSDKDFIIEMWLNKHILASVPIVITIILLGVGYSPYIIVPAGIVCCIYFTSVTLLKKWNDIYTSVFISTLKPNGRIDTLTV